LSLEPGQVLSHYRLQRQIGAGGMGVVWKARDITLDRDVAIKVLPDVFSRDPERLARFEREARLLASLNHPNIATIHGLELAGDVQLLVMELVPGVTLHERLALGPLAVGDALPLFRQMASALKSAHGGEIIHRDLKPANIKITPDDQVKILDFGLAKALAAEPTPTMADQSTAIQTQTGVVAGTANYLSPEQIRGDRLDARSDLFQLGIVFFLALAGKHPFDGPTPVDVQHGILRAAPQWEHLSGKAPEDLLRVIGKLLEKTPGYRYPDAEALEVDLRTAERDSSSESLSVISSPRLMRTWRGVWPRAGAIAAIGLLAAVAAVWLWRLQQPGPWTSAVPSHLRPLTEAGGDNDHPSFSPDGGSVVFTSDRGGNSDLWVTLVGGGDPVQITNTPELESGPAWSPDGARVAFARDRPDRNTSDLYVMPALGGTARRVVEGGHDAHWSPDGRWLTYVESVAGWDRVAKIAVDSPGEPVPITSPENGIFHRFPVWSPDGEWIVFTRSPGGPTGRLMRVPSGGGTPTALIDDPEDVSSIQAVFSPDGRYVIHSSDRGGVENLWRVPFDGGPPEQITSGTGSDHSADVSQDGRRIVFVNRRLDPRVLAVSPTSGSTKLLAEFEGGTCWAPVLSPDGRWIAFSRKPAGRRWSIYVMRSDDGQARALVDSLLNMMWPRFHPDNQSILFFTWPGRQRIGRIHLDGTGLTWLTGEEVEAGYPAVSPDGEWLAYVRRRPGDGVTEDIVVRPFDGGPERVVVPGATLPDFSPDGRMLTFAASRSFSGRVGIVRLEDGEPRWLTTSGTWPTWMPNGRAIAYADQPPEGRQQAWVVALDGGPPKRLGDFGWLGRHYPFDVDPASGQLLTADHVGGKSTIWLAEYD